MAQRFMLYGSSPDALAGQQQNYERLFTGAAEGNRSAAAQAQQASLAAYLQSQAADDQARQFDARNRIALFEEQRRRDVADRVEAEGSRRFDTEVGLRREDMRQRNDENRRFRFPRMQAELEQTRAQTENAKKYNPVALKQLEFAHSRAAEDAANGNIESVAQALKLYHGLTTEDAMNYFQQSAQARREIESQTQELSSAAKTLSAYEQAKRKSLDLIAKKPSGGFLGIGSDKSELEAERLKALNFVSSIEPTAKALQNPRAGIISRLNFDADSGTYTPITPRLPWMKNTSTGTESPASAVSKTSTGTYTSADQVKSAVKSGLLSKDQAVKILQSQFGFE